MFGALAFREGVIVFLRWQFELYRPFWYHFFSLSHYHSTIVSLKTKPLTYKVLHFQDDRQNPLVIYGQSGCGKTSVMSMIAKEAWNISSQSNVVIRYIGTTPNSSQIRLLLRSVCEQICNIYGRNPHTIRKVCGILSHLNVLGLKNGWERKTSCKSNNDVKWVSTSVS